MLFWKQTKANAGIGARATALAGAAAAALAVLVVCRPSAVNAGAAADPTSAVVTAAAWGAWLTALYLLAGVAVTAASRLPHAPRALTAVAGRCAPRVLHRAIDATIGVTAAAAVLTASAGPAFADGPPSPPPSAASTIPGVDWPGLAATTAVRHPHPSPPVALVSPVPHRSAHAGDPTIVVHGGDSLWALAARRIGPGATDAQVAQAWPALYAANRAVIGADPALIHPGQRLVCPPLDPRSES